MGYTILLIDDDSDDRAFFRDAVEEVSRGDITCVTLDDVQAMVSALLDRNEKKPDVIFTDINMPATSGWEVLTMLKEHDSVKKIPVIMYSTSEDRDAVIRAKKMGALCYLVKPHDFVHLKQVMREVAGHIRNGSLTSILNGPSGFL